MNQIIAYYQQSVPVLADLFKKRGVLTMVKRLNKRTFLWEADPLLTYQDCDARDVHLFKFICGGSFTGNETSSHYQWRAKGSTARRAIDTLGLISGGVNFSMDMVKAAKKGNVLNYMSAREHHLQYRFKEFFADYPQYAKDPEKFREFKMKIEQRAMLGLPPLE